MTIKDDEGNTREHTYHPASNYRTEVSVKGCDGPFDELVARNYIPGLESLGFNTKHTITVSFTMTNDNGTRRREHSSPEKNNRHAWRQYPCKVTFRYNAAGSKSSWVADPSSTSLPADCWLGNDYIAVNQNMNHARALAYVWFEFNIDGVSFKKP